ncbi:MAG: DNA polymerase III subunit delta [Bacteroidetes bacterium]|nr:DNA polymerase III subunit delta [Bacteroidota bacterium]MBU1117105.1 DNA polymerase III subunit delta [Bacteroidota bacterium]MBU1798636.1 DNA polymerase III subunit delta [Bacteroidota bacterium]
MKSTTEIESIYNIPKFLKDDSLLPIYFLYGEDSFTINNALKSIENKIAPLVKADFDKESISLSKDNSVSQFIDLAYSFPFGDGKKLITVKNFETISDKKSFANYVKDPSDFTYLLVTQYSKSAPLNQEPYKSLFAKKYIFEAREMKLTELSEWMFKKAKIEKLILSKAAGELLLEMVGGNKAILEMQLRKIAIYSNPDEEITPDIIQKLAEATKEYSIFDLQNALGSGNKAKAIEYAFNLLSNQIEMVFIISMLTKFITNLAQILGISNNSEGIKAIGNSYYFLKNNTFLLNEQRLVNAAKALLEADIRLKTTSIDNKTNLSILIAEILK